MFVIPVIFVFKALSLYGNIGSTFKKRKKKPLTLTSFLGEKIKISEN